MFFLHVKKKSWNTKKTCLLSTRIEKDWDDVQLLEGVSEIEHWQHSTTVQVANLAAQ